MSNLCPALDSGKSPAWGFPGTKGSLSVWEGTESHSPRAAGKWTKAQLVEAGAGVLKPQGELPLFSMQPVTACFRTEQQRSEKLSRGEKGPGPGPNLLRTVHPTSSVQGLS